MYLPILILAALTLIMAIPAPTMKLTLTHVSKVPQSQQNTGAVRAPLIYHNGKDIESDEDVEDEEEHRDRDEDEDEDEDEDRGHNFRELATIPDRFTDIPQMIGVAKDVSASISNGQISGDELTSTMKKLYQAAQPTSTPSNIGDALSRSANMFNLKDNGQPLQNLLASSLGLMMNGIVSDDLRRTIDQPGDDQTFDNPPVPSDKSFYNKRGNAPFSVPEDQLRSAIRIPSGFTNGQKQPVLFSPGTGASGSENFEKTMGTPLSQTNVGDPVYLHIPGHTLLDVQVNAEYVAYALQYLNAMTNRKVAVVTWSQGSIDAQWAFKYWPSVRNITTDHISTSGDYAGTQLAYLLCPGFQSGNQLACTPAIVQQIYYSKLIQRLRSSNGDSAYVPTTTVYSGLDEIVQPQISFGASGYIKDNRGVGVSNNYLQDVCAFQPASGFYTHEGVLYNPVTYALLLDALSNDGPGQMSRVRSSCRGVVTSGLDTGVVIETEAIIPIILFRAIATQEKVVEEPQIKSYATY